MKLPSIGCGLLVFIAYFVFWAWVAAFGAVFSYYAEYEQRDSQAESAITHELWLQELLNHPYAPPCYTLDVKACVTAEQVRTTAAQGKQDSFWFNIKISAIPAVFCAAVLYTGLWFRQRPRARDQSRAKITES